ncbi:ABC transporter permease [Nocardia donostiensis]|uniref:ABC transporter permease n=1 Tax=Nocardia donostiensis TaxID=1538463 RepID=A0A1W0B3K7_9NOCA|nr:ABC transporter permease [Nocardia donostiensis]ONM50695.1 ABC transporter permease [Nocardia donostiensis]OQS17077.1 ABC transporter permease [Nocardia donostiensis]OQS18917.1 ABC transporter permease [Nocardia donostiensis]
MIDIVPAELLPAVDSEYRKAATLRSTRVLGAMLIAIAIVAGSVTAILAGPLDPEGQPVTGAATIGLYLALTIVILTVGAFGAASAGSEYRYDTLAVTALFIPDRNQLIAAKLLVTAGAALAAAAAAEIAALTCLFLFGRDKFEVTGYLFAALGGGLFAAVCWALIGTGIGLWLRSPSFGIATVLGWIFVIEPLIWLVVDGIGRTGLATLLPVSATISTIAVGSFPDSDLLAPAPAAVVVLLLWAIGSSALGWWAVRNTEL